MSSRRAVHGDLTRASQRLDRAAVAVPEVLEHLAEQIAAARVGLGGGGDGRVSGGERSDPTVRAALAAEGLDAQRRLIVEQVTAIHTAITALDTLCRAALGMRSVSAESPPAPRCVGDGGAGGAGCWQVPTERRNGLGQTIDDGRCIDCGRRWDAALAEASNARRARRHAAAGAES